MIHKDHKLAKWCKSFSPDEFKCSTRVTADGGQRLILRPGLLGPQQPHLFGYELVLLARHHFHLCDSLDKHLSGQGCQRKNFAMVHTNMVCVLFAVSSDAWITKLNLPKLVGLLKKAISITLPKHKVSCCKRRKMAGVLLRETSRTEPWRHIPSRQACVMSDVGRCLCFRLVFKRTKIIEAHRNTMLMGATRVSLRVTSVMLSISTMHRIQSDHSNYD